MEFQFPIIENFKLKILLLECLKLIECIIGFLKCKSSNPRALFRPGHTKIEFGRVTKNL
jgi:hypothetical protein